MSGLIKKITALFICLLAIISSVLSCSAPQGGADGTSVSVSGETAGTETEGNTAKSLLGSFEKKDFGGESFRIITSNAYNGTIYVPQAPLGEQNGEPVNDALYTRDRLLEEYFNISIDYTVMQYEHDGSKDLIYPEVQKSVTAGDDLWDLIFGSMAMVIVPSISSGYIVDFNKVPNLGLSAKWWNKNAIKDMQVNGKMYFATGDITPRYVTSAFVLLFDKKLFNDYNIEYPYEAVRDGSWTVEKFAEIIKDKAYDIDQDGKTDKDDFWGLSPESGSIYAFYVGAGQNTIKVGSSGEPEIACDSQESFDAIDKIASVISTDDVFKPTVTYYANTAFKEGRSLFLDCAVCDITLLRDMNNDFGILPNPKFDEAQADYYSHSNPWIATSVAIPATSRDTGKAGLLTDALAAVSSATSMPAQYDITMQQKQARDNDSIEMLQLAVEATKYDLGYLFGWGGMTGVIESALTSGTAYASKIEAAKKGARKVIDKFIETISAY